MPGAFRPARPGWHGTALLMIRPGPEGAASNLTSRPRGVRLLRGVLRLVLDPEFLELGAQGLARDAEQLRGARLVALTHRQRVLDRELLDLVHRTHHARRERRAAAGPGGRGATAGQLGPHVLR